MGPVPDTYDWEMRGVLKLVLTASMEAGSQGCWLRGPMCLRAVVGFLVVKIRTQQVLGLVLACWQVSWVLPQQAAGIQLSWGWYPPAGGWGQGL